MPIGAPNNTGEPASSSAHRPQTAAAVAEPDNAELPPVPDSPVPTAETEPVEDVGDQVHLEDMEVNANEAEAEQQAGSANGAAASTHSSMPPLVDPNDEELRRAWELERMGAENVAREEMRRRAAADMMAALRARVARIQAPLQAALDTGAHVAHVGPDRRTIYFPMSDAQQPNREADARRAYRSRAIFIPDNDRDNWLDHYRE